MPVPTVRFSRTRKNKGPKRLNLMLAIARRRQTETSIAANCGCSASVVSRLVSGHRDPTPRMRSKIAQLLKADPNWLFDQAGPAVPLPWSLKKAE